MAHVNDLPNEILIKIFHYLQIENQHEFLNCFYYVCRKWREVAKDSSFFETLDGSLPLDIILELSKAGSLQRTKVMKFTRPIEAKKSLYKIMYTNMPLLKRIDLTNVRHTIKDGKKHIFFTELKGHWPNLSGLAITDSEEIPKENIAVGIFERMISIRGPNLVVLYFSCLTLVNSTYMFEHIANNCPNLEELSARSLRCSSRQPQFSIENMQNGCPKLKTLQIGYPVSYKRGFGKGFPNLETFVNSSKTDKMDFEFESSTLWELLCNSPNLKILDFRNCPMVSYEVVNSLPAINLEHIYLSQVLDERSYFKLLQKWSHSLIVIYVSHLKTLSMNRTIQDLCLPNGFPNLEIFVANYTLMTLPTLKFVIEHSPKLKLLDLRKSSCLKKDKAIVYNSRSEVENLLLKLESEIK